MGREDNTVHWRFRETPEANDIKLCDATPKQVLREGSIILKPTTRTGKYVGNCGFCHEVGRAHGLLNAEDD